MHVDGELGMEAVIGIERGTIDRGLMSVVVCEFCERQEAYPIVLLVVAIDTKVLFDGLVHSFGLTVGLGMKGS